MAIPTNSAHYVIHGTLRGGLEEFVTGFWTQDMTINNETQANEVLAALAANGAFGNWLAEIARCLDSSCVIDELKVYCYVQGRQQAQYIGQRQLNVAGTSSQSNLPLQVCQVVTLLTRYSGRRNRGRMYIPRLNTNLTGEHEFGQLTTEQLAQTTASMLDAVASLQFAGTPAVVSRTGSDSTEISACRVDSKPDIQRRRAESMNPSIYVTSALSAG